MKVKNKKKKSLTNSQLLRRSINEALAKWEALTPEERNWWGQLVPHRHKPK